MSVWVCVCVVEVCLDDYTIVCLCNCMYTGKFVDVCMHVLVKVHMHGSRTDLHTQIVLDRFLYCNTFSEQEDGCWRGTCGGVALGLL